MIIDFEKGEIPPQRPAVVVLGAGAVGIVLAVTLARKGIRVVLCECGGRSVESAAQALNAAQVIGRPHTGISEGRARVLGGTSTLWGGQLIAFQPIDFQARPWLGLEGWPISRADLDPYYVALTEMFGLPLREGNDEAVWGKLGIMPPDLAPDLEFVLTRWLKQPNLARMFASDLSSNPNLTVMLHASATGFVPADATRNDGRQHIAAVHLRAPSGHVLNLAADDIVITTGTIEASRLMLAAAQERPALAWANNPWVGTSFQDHLDLRGGSVKPLDRKRFDEAFDNIFLKGFKYNPKIVLARSLQEEFGTTNIAANFVFESSFSEHLENIKIFIRALRNGALPPNLYQLPAHIKAMAKIWWPLILRYLKDNRAFNPGDLGISLRLHCEQRPIARSKIRLDLDRCDGNGVPLPVLDWQIDGGELDAMAVFTERLAETLERSDLARVEIDPRITARDPAIFADTRDTNHHCGGLQMSSDPTKGVVDADLTVHGTSNLSIAGAAVYPSSSFANPTFTAMALALRLADHLTKAN